jgi:hypothetical protein
MRIIREINLYFLITIYEENFSIEHRAISQQKACDIYHTFVMTNVTIFILPYLSKINGDPFTPNMCIPTKFQHLQSHPRIVCKLFPNSCTIIPFQNQH